MPDFRYVAPRFCRTFAPLRVDPGREIQNSWGNYLHRDSLEYMEAAIPGRPILMGPALDFFLEPPVK